MTIASVLTYLASLATPAFTVMTIEPGPYMGWFVLLMGFTGLTLVGSSESLFMCLAWLANIAFIATHVSLLRDRLRRALALSFAGVVLASCFALVKDTSMQGMCTHHPVRLDEGYFLWVASMVLALASASTRAWADGAVSAKDKRAALWMLLGALAYIALGLLLPPGKCALLR